MTMSISNRAAGKPAIWSALMSALLWVASASGVNPVLAAEPDGAIAIIGTGKVAGALGPRLAQAGHKVIYGSRDPRSQKVLDLVKLTGSRATSATPEAAAGRASMVIFAVPWGAAEATVKSLGDLSNKVILDTTNVVDVREGQDFVMRLSSSGAELIQGWAPRSHVVKAFNTTNWSVMANPAKAVGGKVTIPLAGDDSASKQRAATLVKELGFDAFDTGPLINARYIEGMALLYISMLVQNRPDAAEFHLQARPK